MKEVTYEMLQAMFKHLMVSYNKDETLEILLAKYPAFESDLYLIAEEADKEPVVNEVPKAKDVVKIAKTKAPVEAKQSKRALAKQLYEQATDKSRAAIIDLFVKELVVSKANASTYYYNIVKG